LLGPVVALLVIGAAGSACALVSGWADLQTDVKRSNTNANADGGNGPSDAPDGGVVGGSPGPFPQPDGGGSGPRSTAVDCGGKTCTGTDGCCAPDQRTPSCTNETKCTNELQGTWFTCDRPSACQGTPDKPFCCYDATTEVAACSASCTTAFQRPVCDGADQGKRYEIADVMTRRVLIGQSPACDVQISNRSASRRHAALMGDASGVRILDVGSRNGTWIGALRVQDAYLRPGGGRVRRRHRARHGAH
jgi:hypothetical protein